MTAGELVEALRAFDAEDRVSLSVYLPELMVWCEAHDAYLVVDEADEPVLTGDLDHVKQLHAAG